MDDPGTRVLLIDDDEGFGLLVKKDLERSGYVVELAQSSSDGLSRIEGGSIDAVVLDHHLPDQDGLTVLHHIQALKDPPPVVYLTGASVNGKRTMMAVRAGGRGDVSATHVLWTQKAGGGLASPLLVGDHLYFIAGTVSCLRADTGKIVYTERLYDAKQEYASPVAADRKVILFTRRDGAFVLAAGPKLEQLAHNDLADRSDFSATPAISAGRMFVRSNTHLYCIGKRN